MENNLAKIRKEKKIGQGYLVEMLGVSRQTISSIENGRCTPSLELAMDIANLLEMPIEEIMKTGKPDYPFCIGWANHDWSNKTWEKSPKYQKEII